MSMSLGLALALAWLVQSALATLLVALQWRALRMPQPQPEAFPCALVLVPVRGPLLPGFLPALAAQAWPNWRVVFALEDMADPAWAEVAAFCAAEPARRALVLAGATQGRAQKLHNLLAALALRGPADTVVVTFDADGLPPPGTLHGLLRPLLTGQAEISTGYRWLLPEAGWGAWLVAQADVAVSCMPRMVGGSAAWGGATAFSARALALLDLPRLWAAQVSDDGAVSLAAARLGLHVYAPPGVRVPAPVRYSLLEAFSFARRQLRLVWVLALPAWALAAMVALLPLAGFAGAMASGAWAVPLAAWALLLPRLALRGRLARAVLPEAASHVAVRALWRGPVLAPLVALFSAACVLASPGARLDWGGRRYWLARGGRVLRLAPWPPRAG